MYQPARSISYTGRLNPILTIQSLAVSLRTTSLNIQKFYMVLALRRVFCKDLRTESGLWCIHN